MPWLIKNDDILQYEPGYEAKKKKKKTKKNDRNDTNDTSLSPTPSSQSTQSQSQSQSLFFVHVPRCGGTSLMHYYELPRKIYTSYRYNYWKRLGMYAFFSRYKTLEANNFPFFTSGNAFALVSAILGITFMSTTQHDYVPYYVGIILLLFGITLFILLTIVFTAPVIGRFPIVHHGYLIFVHYMLCQFMECTSYVTGTNKTGYMMHLTAHKLLHTYQYVTIPQWEIACSMAIVRNPYSRMISIYTYNRFGEWESFTHFMKDWYHNVTKYYRLYNNCDEWYTPCHAIPQFEYTHTTDVDGTPIQLVKSIIKQEELKYLKNDGFPTTGNTATMNATTDTNHNDNNKQQQEQQHIVSATATGENTAEYRANEGENGGRMLLEVGEDTAEIRTSSSSPSRLFSNTYPKKATTAATLSVDNLPQTVRDALINMPHSNQRTLKKKWYDYYTQETLDLVYEIYYQDFIYFDYNPVLEQRPDLQPPSQFLKKSSSSETKDYPSRNNNSNHRMNHFDIEIGNVPSNP